MHIWLLVVALLYAGEAFAGDAIDDIQPAPPSIGADVPVTYFGPAPSSVKRELVGPVQLLKSGTIDFTAGTITMPLYRGSTVANGKTVGMWYVVTDTTDEANAAALGINPSSKLKYTIGTPAANPATLGAGATLRRQAGWVDFSPVRSLTPGPAPNYFPPARFTPGSVGQGGYSPLVVLANEVYNAPIIAGDVNASTLNRYCGGIPANESAAAYRLVHDKVVAICAKDGERTGTVMLRLTQGFSFAKPVLYLSFEGNNGLPATLEAATHAPALTSVTVGGDDSLFSPVERIFVVTNGFTNGNKGPGSEASHPGRQGLNSAIRDGKSPLNVLGGIPSVATDYSPLWDMNIGEWTPYAIANQYRTRWLEEFQILGFAQRGFITGPGGSDFGSTGNVVNCPIVHRFL